MSKKILVIPSWYPTSGSPATGNFCRQQAELVSNEYSIKILYPRLRVISKKKAITQLVKKTKQDLSDNLLGKLPGVEIQATVSTFTSLQRQVDILVKKCVTWLSAQAKNGWKPDLIHAHGTIMGGVVAAAVGKKFNTPVILTEHHSLLVKDFDKEKWLMYKSAMESSNLVAIVSNELKKMILMNGVRCKTAVVGNLVDEDIFFFRPASFEIRPFKVLFIGVPAFTKDIPTLLKALKTLKSTGVNNFQATLIIPDIVADLTRDEIIGLCNAYDLFGNCIFLGNTPHEKIPEIIQNCDVLISTSITETFGLSVAEALMCGKPVIATKSGGVEDFVSAKNGFLVNIGDYQEIARILTQLMDGSSSIDSEAVSENMRSRFGKLAFKTRISSIYEDVIHQYYKASL